ncbi:MAG: glycosyltransferase family 2 protein, partial [Vicinamibacterales bacterium]
DYPADRLEIVVVDGMSEDGSAEIARAFLSTAPQKWRLIDNPQRTTPHAWNLGILDARGDVIVVVIAHSELATDYVRQAVTVLDETGADCVGGSITTLGEPTPVGRAIALALSSTFGVGGSAFRTRTGHSGFVDTVPFGVYRREVFARFGLLDPDFVRNQDTEINFRITKNRGRIWMDGRLTSVYHPRSTLRSLWRQHLHTGASKIQILAKYGSLPALRHYIPGAFVAASVASVSAAPIVREPMVAMAVVGPYLIALAIAGVWVARHSPTLWPFVVIAMMTMHVSYGLGSLWGVWRYFVSPRWHRHRLPRTNSSRSERDGRRRRSSLPDSTDRAR